MKKFDKPSAIHFLTEVKKLAEGGDKRITIAKHMDFKTVATFNSYLINASQISGEPIPPFLNTDSKSKVAQHVLEVRRRGRGQAFSLNIPQQPLEDIQVKMGDRVELKIRGKTLSVKKVSAS